MRTSLQSVARRSAVTAGTAVLVGALAGCGADGFASSAQETTLSAPPTESFSATPTATDLPETTSSPTGSATSSGGVLGRDSTGDRLTLADFFRPPSYWQESRYDIADKADVQGMGTTVASCDENGARTLEMRLSNNFDSLRFKVGQANDSESSDQNLVVEVIANNEQVEIRRVPFNQIQDFEIPVDAVNALKINFFLDPDTPECGGSVVAVPYDVSLS
jgi:hypothetical protein